MNYLKNSVSKSEIKVLGQTISESIRSRSSEIWPIAK